MRRFMLAITAFLFCAMSSASEYRNEVPVGGKTLAPVGWKMFCEDYPKECIGRYLPAVISYSEEIVRTLADVNARVNANVLYMTDGDQWGTADKRYVSSYPGGVAVERWTFAENGIGDCEDHALLKRQILIEEGLPRSALLITIVRKNDAAAAANKDQNILTDGLHAVLIVKTDQGDLVLDIEDPRVLPWWQKNFTYLSRQSERNPNEWVSLKNPK